MTIKATNKKVGSVITSRKNATIISNTRFMIFSSNVSPNGLTAITIVSSMEVIMDFANSRSYKEGTT
ncbi:hypothetical protein PN4B1_22820 [Paenibacillus naphthalenovorans]|nr:hypothetical protein PN4B1_22820 [Paenibacillus naphthalenovorans]